MTGYGKSVAENDIIKVESEVKSINSRYLEVALKLPSSLAHKEYELREIIKSKIKRGKLSIILQIKKNENKEDSFFVNKEKLKKYLSTLKELKKIAKITEKIKLEHLLYNKDLFEGDEFDISDDDFELVKKTLDNSLDQLLKMKKNEGKELEIDLEKRIKIISDKLEEIESEAKKSVNEYFTKLEERIKLLINDITVDKERLALELALIADKAEITEECVRLRSHLKFFTISLQNESEAGRKLNFLCQEMNREANTISSKTISTAIMHSSVLIKEEIEKIREQIQNIE